MRIVLTPNFGKMVHYDFCITDVTAEVEDHEHVDALELGFLLLQNKWRHCRSTRVNLSLTNYASKLDGKILDTYHLDHLVMINEKYARNRSYSLSKFDTEITSIDLVMGYNINDHLVAWSKIRQYNGAKELAFFAWDGVHSHLSMARLTLEHEIAWAKSLNDKYVYIGPGYESCSIYKSKVAGFEWWNGTIWSTDIAEYANLCHRDSEINDFTRYQNKIL